MNNNSVDRALEWEDEIEKESGGWTLLPDGDYDFTVTAFERARHEGSEKLPPCNKAIVSIHIESPEGETTIRHNLFLHTKTEGMLSAFFVAIGQKKHGEKLKMNWQKVIGAKGRCKVGVREWTGADGQIKQSNEIKRFYDPENNTDSTPAASTSSAPSVPGGGVYTPGKF